MPVLRKVCQPLEFCDAVDGNEADPAGAGGEQLVVRLSRAVQRDALGLESGSLGGHEFAQRTDVDADWVGS